MINRIALMRRLHSDAADIRERPQRLRLRDRRAAKCARHFAGKRIGHVVGQLACQTKLLIFAGSA